MTRVRCRRRINAAPDAIWQLAEDPHHLPRWWPGVRRVEGVSPERWTQVIYTRKGRPVRVDMRLLESDPPRRRTWEQEVAGTPFERVLAASVIELAIEPADGGSHVTIEHRQQLRGYSRTGGFMLRRATRRKLDEALDGLEQIFG